MTRAGMSELLLGKGPDYPAMLRKAEHQAEAEAAKARDHYNKAIEAANRARSLLAVAEDLRAMIEARHITPSPSLHPQPAGRTGS